MTSKLTRLTDEELEEIAFYAGESICHPDPNYQLGFESLATGHSVLSIVRDLQERRKAAMDSEPMAEITEDLGRLFVKIHYPTTLKAGDKLYRHVWSVSVVDADDNFYSWFGREWAENYQHNQYTTAAKQMLGVMAESAWKAGCRATMLNQK